MNCIEIKKGLRYYEPQTFYFFIYFENLLFSKQTRQYTAIFLGDTLGLTMIFSLCFIVIDVNQTFLLARINVQKNIIVTESSNDISIIFYRF
jgi:hypothetical protein